MALRIRLARSAQKSAPTTASWWLIASLPGMVVSWKSLALTTPASGPAAVTVKEDLLAQWVSKGATPTDTVASLLKKRPQAAAAPEA